MGRTSRFPIWTGKRARLACLVFRQLASEESVWECFLTRVTDRYLLGDTRVEGMELGSISLYPTVNVKVGENILTG